MKKGINPYSEEAIETVVAILKGADLNVLRTASLVQVLEPDLPKAIRALHKSGFHRTKSVYDDEKYLAVRRFNLMTELELPKVMFGSNNSVEKRRREAKRTIEVLSLSPERLAEKVEQDQQIDVSYNSMLEIYRLKQENNAWRNTMQFVLPSDAGVDKFITLIDKCVQLHETGSAIDIDRFDIRWGHGRQTGYAQMQFIPSSGRFKFLLEMDQFIWSHEGENFRYSDSVDALQRDVEHFLEENGDASSYQWTTKFRERLKLHRRLIAQERYWEEDR